MAPSQAGGLPPTHEPAEEGPLSADESRTARDEGLRQLSDPKTMRALAHPTRLALLEAILREGPLTATEAANLLDDSPGNISWHLGILAKYGYIEEVGAKGRRRPWRLASLGASFSPANEEARDFAAAEEALETTVLEMSRARYRQWQASRHAFGAEWRRASFTNVSIEYLTAEELDALSNEFTALLQRYSDRAVDRAQRPRDALPVQVTAMGHPLPPMSKKG